MIKGYINTNLSNTDKWNVRLWRITYVINIYRNNDNADKRYEVNALFIEDKDLQTYFKTFREAAREVNKTIKQHPDFNKYIPDIMRLTALITEEEN